jgi:glycolate oxidase FAD binding subunit
MPSVVESLPLTETIAPADQAGVAEAVRAAHDAREPVYPLGGQTSLDYGIAPKRPGRGLDMTGLKQIVDYTPRDMTILVEAGVRMADLAATLAAENQHLPIDVPRAREATIGGAVATNWSGPRRYGYGTLRDYVIGIRAVDGRGVTFNGGGRVVKNVAGYDFCKLLTGSLGTLGVVTQLALKVRPVPEMVAAVVVDCADLNVAENALERLVDLPTPPTAIDLLVGSVWHDSPWLVTGNEAASALVVRVEGTETEVDWLGDQVASTLALGGGEKARVLKQSADDEVLADQVGFPDHGLGEAADDSPLVVKIAVTPSAVVEMVGQLLAVDPDCAILAHAGSGIITARFAKFKPVDVSRTLVAKLRPAAIAHGGSLIVLSGKLPGITPSIMWGVRTEATVLMERIKRQFDPHDILNPGRFVY